MEPRRVGVRNIVFHSGPCHQVPCGPLPGFDYNWFQGKFMESNSLSRITTNTYVVFPAHVYHVSICFLKPRPLHRVTYHLVTDTIRHPFPKNLPRRTKPDKPSICGTMAPSGLAVQHTRQHCPTGVTWRSMGVNSPNQRRAYLARTNQKTKTKKHALLNDHLNPSFSTEMELLLLIYG